MKHTSKVLKIILSLALMVFVITMTPGPFNFGLFEEAEAADLTNIAVLPTSSYIGQRTTWDFIFNTATTGEVKTVEMQFTPDFDISKATKLVERTGIGPGSLSLSSTPTGPRLIYTVDNQESIPAGTTIRLEIGKIVAHTDGSLTVGIKTKNTSGQTIDGLTNSEVILSSVGGSDVSPSFMIRKTLLDDAAGNAQGWNPDGKVVDFIISDSDIAGSADNLLVDINIASSTGNHVCAVGNINVPNGFFRIRCVEEAGAGTPIELSRLNYVITKLPANVVTSSLSLSSSESASPFASLQDRAASARGSQLSPSLP